MAEEISGLANTVYADGPVGTPTHPPKPDIRTLFGVVQAQVDAAKSIAANTTQWKDPVDLATTGNVTLSGEQTIDGTLTSTTDIFVKSQSADEDNGIYTTATGAWSRRSDANTAEEIVGMAVFVRSGTVNGGKQFVCSTPAPIVLGTTDLIFAEISDQSALNATLAEKADQTQVDELVTTKAWQDQFETVYGSEMLDTEFAEAYVSEDGRRMLGGFRHDGTVEWLDSRPLLDTEFVYAEVDDDGKVLWGIKHDGTFSAYGLGAGASTDDGVTQVMSRSGQIIVQRDGLRSPITFINYNENPSVNGDFVSYMEDDGTTLVARTEEMLCLTSVGDDINEIVHIPVTGQSLSRGPTPAVHTSAVRAERVVMFNGGVDCGSSGPSAISPPNLYGWVDAFEPERESPALAMGWGLTEAGRLDASQAALVSMHGVNGAAYSAIKKGTQPYANLLESIRRSRVVATRNGFTYKVPAVRIIHGEANRADAKATYKAYMLELQADLTTDINAITGQSGQVLLVLDQISNWTAPDFSMATCEIPFAQLEVAIENPTKIICVGSKYPLPTGTDGVHLTPASSARLGSHDAVAIDQHLKWIAGEPGSTPWLPLCCTGAIRTGSVIRLTMNVPDGNLTLDVAAVTDPGSYGITWNQTGGTARSISSIAIDGADIVVTLTGDPGSPSASSIGIAATGTIGANGGPTTGPRSNFRDQAADLDVDGNAMPNWAAHQLITL